MRLYTLSPDGTRLVCTTMEGAFMEIFDIKDLTLTPRVTKCMYPYEVEMRGNLRSVTDDSMQGFSAVCATDSRIMSPPLLGQLVAEVSIDTPAEYMLETYNEYVERRKFLIDQLNKIPGCYSPIPMGAFYTVVRLPVDDADRFCAWCLEEFDYEGETVFMAPASGFYTTPGMGRDEVRMAYVLKKEDLARAMLVLRKALEAYPGRKEPSLS